MLYTVASQSYIGGRARNEDRVSVSSRNDAVLMVLAGGLGGHDGPDIASQGLIDAMTQSFERTPTENLADPVAFLQLAIKYAHSVIRHRAAKNKLPPHVPKTTCVACLIIDGIAWWAHAGDSRLYLYRDGRMAYRTEDHSNDSTRDIESDTISRYVGGRSQPDVTIGPKVRLEHNDMILLCSDGAWRNIESADVMKHIEPELPQNGLNKLLRALELRNQEPSDNLSAIALCWGVEYASKNNIREEQMDLLKGAVPEPIITPDNTPTEPEYAENSKSQKQTLESFDSMIAELENFVDKFEKSR
ncbi:MAG: serine/threonine-protein phosphatase [Proteobacteria bacterium]|nr:serine/threonine-protein phosphatase [Pseudomonadota bacterium]